MLLNQHTYYTNSGNSGILQLLDESDRSILDIGCGAGDLGNAIRQQFSSATVTGVTCSSVEQQQALQKLNRCFCLDIERESLSIFNAQTFDTIIFSHVLEHLVDPVVVIIRLLPFLKKGGRILIALPNIANWRQRWKLALGKFEYTESGVMDRTHLHFYTFHTAPKYLIDPIAPLKIQTHSVSGSVPLAFLRHYFLSNGLREKIDKLGCRWDPNLFGGEILISAVHI
jgi:2-polyprenyl-3-methyl-5-hydroxy-6-metoxy-1,4-benzoquinol methylase